MNSLRTKPEIKNELKFQLENISVKEYSNGLKIFYLQKEKLPLIRLNFIVEAGSKFDSLSIPGLARLTSAMIDEGAGGLSSLELSDEFDLLGTDFKISTDNDFIVLSLQSLSENIERSLKLLSLVITKPDFPESEFEREKKKLLVSILQLKDNPEAIADQVFDKVIFQNHYYSFPVSGYFDTVEKITLQDIKKFYTNSFKADKSFIAAAGNLSAEKFYQLIEKYFQNFTSSESTDVLSDKLITADKKVFVYDKPESVQTEIRIGYVSGKRSSKDFFRKHLLNTIFGGQFNSRLNSNLREQNGFTYGVSSQFSYLKDSGYFVISTSVNTDNTFAAVREILKELDNLKDGINSEELNFAKTSLTRKFPLNFETYRQLTSNLSSLAIQNLPIDYFNTYLTNLTSVSIEEVNAEALKLSQADMKIVLVGNRDSFANEFIKNGFELIDVDERGEIL
ncbi:Putative Zn-dependent peptidase [Ignavibacterium album JCM 16511]|uniref:Putative Zn-dependent peptidase n=1 Tax=Ignavibacterium album (strain DSM 19864 / JCM 16511 / NBRC 101810 / Mat9-16) TaxID=945713 RepID=I0ALT2_IGNAJ|nr:pitrilysin family protein [Ignavibacterium album]AFH49939.1 Putative Zn-dependent peptidase [Ignavibacterium album JCM 16511]